MKEFEKLKKGQEENNRQTKQLRNDIDQLRKGQKDIVETLEDITLNHTTREEFYSLKKKVFRHHPTPIK